MLFPNGEIRHEIDTYSNAPRAPHNPPPAVDLSDTGFSQKGDVGRASRVRHKSRTPATHRLETRRCEGRVADVAIDPAEATDGFLTANASSANTLPEREWPSDRAGRLSRASGFRPERPASALGHVGRPPPQRTCSSAQDLAIPWIGQTLGWLTVASSCGRHVSDIHCNAPAVLHSFSSFCGFVGHRASLDASLSDTGSSDTMSDMGRSRQPLPGQLAAQLGCRVAGPDMSQAVTEADRFASLREDDSIGNGEPKRAAEAPLQIALAAELRDRVSRFRTELDESERHRRAVVAYDACACLHRDVGGQLDVQLDFATQRQRFVLDPQSAR